MYTMHYSTMAFQIIKIDELLDLCNVIDILSFIVRRTRVITRKERGMWRIANNDIMSLTKNMIPVGNCQWLVYNNYVFVFYSQLVSSLRHCTSTSIYQTR